MSEIAEIRKLFQDLIAPDVKSIAIDLAALKTGVDRQFKSAEDLAKARYGAVLAKMETMDTRLSSMETRLSSMETMQAIRHEAILRALDIDKRLEKVEAQQAATAAA